MLTRRMSVRQARSHFSDVIGQVYYTKEAVIVEKRGKAFAVVISPEQYETMQDQPLDNQREEVKPMNEALKAIPAQIKPLTAEQASRRLAALERARALTETMRARRGGRRLPDSTSLIRQEREERSARL